MRVLAALGAICFAYLAIIPGAVVGATIDPACSGSQCSYSPPVTVYMVLVFAASSLALVASAVTPRRSMQRAPPPATPAGSGPR